jgi:tetratricopeptide (TPR) repeat protein
VQTAAGDVEGAVASFGRAAEIARAAGAQSLVLWANVSAAAALIDTGRAGEAEPYLSAAAAVDPYDPLLLVHVAETRADRGQVREALDIYESLLGRHADPVLHAAAFGLRQRLGDKEAAGRHFSEAEAGFRGAIDAGEVYTLDALARLYLEGDTKLDEARSLAQRNLRFKRDEQAQQVLRDIEARISERR